MNRQHARPVHEWEAFERERRNAMIRKYLRAMALLAVIALVAFGFLWQVR